jgi:hypothetical protein
MSITALAGADDGSARSSACLIRQSRAKEVRSVKTTTNVKAGAMRGK